MTASKWPNTQVIAVHSGSFEAYGEEKVSWTTLAQSAPVGADKILISEENHGWKTGDQIVIATAGGAGSREQNEKRKIRSFYRRIITLDRPLRFEHEIGTEDYGGIGRNFEIEVINLSRNIKITGKLEEKGFGGHLVGGNGADFIKLSHVEFENVGQEFKLGKYPIHFHLTGRSGESFVEACSVHKELF